VEILHNSKEEESEWRTRRIRTLAMATFGSVRTASVTDEIDALRHDIERHIAIATEQANHIAKLEACLAQLFDLLILARNTESGETLQEAIDMVAIATSKEQ
jgi:hypothetical protein